jgi:hypothetical protein
MSIMRPTFGDISVLLAVGGVVAVPVVLGGAARADLQAVPRTAEPADVIQMGSPELGPKSRRAEGQHRAAAATVGRKRQSASVAARAPVGPGTRVSARRSGARRGGERKLAPARQPPAASPRRTGTTSSAPPVAPAAAASPAPLSLSPPQPSQQQPVGPSPPPPPVTLPPAPPPLDLSAKPPLPPLPPLPPPSLEPPKLLGP